MEFCKNKQIENSRRNQQNRILQNIKIEILQTQANGKFQKQTTTQNFAKTYKLKILEEQPNTEFLNTIFANSTCH